MINFLYLQSIVREKEKNIIKKLKSNTSFYPRFSEKEINGFLTYIFLEWSPPYKRKILKYFDLMYVLQYHFYLEHGYYLDPKKTLDLLILRSPNYKSWQIKLLVQKGALSKESKNIIIQNLSPKLNLKRFLMNNLSKMYTSIENPQQIEFLQNIFFIPHWYNKRGNIQETIQQLKILYEWLTYSLIVLESSNQNVLDYKKIDSFYLNSKQTIYYLTPSLWEYNKTNQKEKNLIRRNKILEKQKKQTKNIIKISDIRSSNKPNLENKNLLEKYTIKLHQLAEKKYNTILTPNQTAALLWKIREGFAVETALKIYVQDKKRIRDIYKNIFQKSELSVTDNNIITYLSEQMNFSPYSIDQIKETLNIAKIIEKNYNQLLNIKITTNEILTAAHRTYYSGATREQIKTIFKLTKNCLENLNNLLVLPESEIFKYKLINILTSVLEIEFFEPAIEPSYSDATYQKIVSTLLENESFPYYYKSSYAIRYICNNLRETNQSPYNFQHLIFKNKKLHNLLLNNGYDTKLHKLLIYSDMTFQIFSNRLYFYNLLPPNKIKNIHYFWNSLNRRITNHISIIREKQIINYLKTELKTPKNLSLN